MHFLIPSQLPNALQVFFSICREKTARETAGKAARKTAGKPVQYSPKKMAEIKLQFKLNVTTVSDSFHVSVQPTSSWPCSTPAPLHRFSLKPKCSFLFCACKQARNWVWLIPHVPRLHLHVATCLPLPLIMQRGKSNSIKCKGQIQIKRLSRQKLKRCCLHSSNNNKSNGYNNKYNCNNTKRRSKAQNNIRITINTARQDICSIYRLENIDNYVEIFKHRISFGGQVNFKNY